MLRAQGKERTSPWPWALPEAGGRAPSSTGWSRVTSETWSEQPAGAGSLAGTWRVGVAPWDQGRDCPVTPELGWWQLGGTSDGTTLLQLDGAQAYSLAWCFPPCPGGSWAAWLVGLGKEGRSPGHVAQQASDLPGPGGAVQGRRPVCGRPLEVAVN